MDRNSEPVKFWHVCGPLLLYWVIQFVAQLVAELAVMIPHIGQVMDYDALEKSTTTEEMTKAIMSSVQGMYEIVGKYIMPILAFSALCTLFLTVPLFLKDRKKERILYKQAVKVPGVKKYLVVFGLGSAFLYRIKLSDDVVCPGVVLLRVQRCGYADECGRAVDLYGDHRAGCGRVDVQGACF